MSHREKKKKEEKKKNALPCLLGIYGRIMTQDNWADASSSTKWPCMNHQEVEDQQVHLRVYLLNGYIKFGYHEIRLDSGFMRAVWALSMLGGEVPGLSPLGQRCGTHQQLPMGAQRVSSFSFVQFASSNPRGGALINGRSVGFCSPPVNVRLLWPTSPFQFNISSSLSSYLGSYAGPRERG